MDISKKYMPILGIVILITSGIIGFFSYKQHLIIPNMSLITKGILICSSILAFIGIMHNIKNKQN